MQASRIFLTGGVALAVLLATVGSATADPENRAYSAVQTQTSQSVTAEAGSGKGPLSPRLQAIAAGKPKSAAALTTAAHEAGLPKSGTGSLMRGPGGVSVEVIIRVEAISLGVARALKAAGAQITVVSSETSSYAAYVAPKDLAAVTAVPGVIAVSEVLQRWSDPDARPAATKATADVGAAACAPAASLADTQLRAALARTNFGVDGTGVKVGVISTSYAHKDLPTSAAQDVASGNLPGTGNPCGRTTPVQIVTDNSLDAGNDEGRAMLQLVHKVAPGATLLFATGHGPGGELGFADNIRAMQAAGADIIVDDIGYTNEPVFQDGIASKAISDVTALGVTYLSAAGNFNQLVDGNDVGSIELPSLRPTSCPPAVAAIPGVPANSCLDFAPNGPPSNTAWYEFQSGGFLYASLQYSQPLYGVTDDLDLYVLNEAEDTVLASSTGNSIAAGTPYEDLALYPPGGKVKLAVSRITGTGTPRVRITALDAGLLVDAQYQTSFGVMTVGPSIEGHNGGTDTLSVAATSGLSFTEDAPGGSLAFSGDGTTPASFSSRGPVTHYWGPFTNFANPATAIPATVLNKPDFTATTFDCTTFFDSEYVTTASYLHIPDLPPRCPYLFPGTSAAAPNAAGVAALLLSRNGTLTPAQVKEKLISSATPMSGGNAVSTGAGLLDANAALALVPLPPPAAPLSASYVNVRKNRAVVRWAGSVGATGYRVLVNGRTKCTTSANRSQCRIKRAWGQRALVQVIALGADGNSPATAAKFTRSKRPIVFGTVHFKPDSSKLGKRSKASLRRYAELLAGQGFRQVTVAGYTAKNSERGSKKYRTKLSRARAKATRRVIQNKLYNLNVHIKVTIKARGSKNPVGNNNTKQGQAKNRRATINIR